MSKGLANKRTHTKGGQREKEADPVEKGERYMKTRMFHSSLSTFDRYQVKFGVCVCVSICCIAKHRHIYSMHT